MTSHILPSRTTSPSQGVTRTDPSPRHEVPTARVWGVVIVTFVLIFATTIVIAVLGESSGGSSVVPGLDSLLRLVSAAYIG